MKLEGHIAACLIAILVGFLPKASYAFYVDEEELIQESSPDMIEEIDDDGDIIYVQKVQKKSPVKHKKSSQKTSVSKDSRAYNFSESIGGQGRRVFIYNPKTLSWAAYESDGSLIRVGAGSGGRSYCADVGRRCRTPIGVFRVYSKVGPEFRSSKFPVPNGGAPMPYAMFFHGGFAIHGSYDVPRYNASHGCIRVLPEDAEWLNTEFLEYGSKVIVKPY